MYRIEHCRWFIGILTSQALVSRWKVPATQNLEGTELVGGETAIWTLVAGILNGLSFFQFLQCA